MEHQKQTDYDVAVVGCGPVGLVLLNFLAQQGLSVVGIESYKTILETPRAAHLDDEVLRIFQALGLAHELEPTFTFPVGYEYFDENWNRFLHLDVRPGRSEQGWRYDYLFYQPDFERRLRTVVSTFSHAKLMLGCEVIALSQQEQSVTVHAKERKGETTYDLTAQYVVGCDGANSFVRGVMDSPLEDLHGTQRWLIVDVMLQPGVQLPQEKMFEYCRPVRPVTYVPMVAPHLRFEFKLEPEDLSADMERHERVQELIDPWFKPDEVVIQRADVYEFHGMLAQGWRKDRLLIAGDAAHQMPPKMGQGLCSGFRDTINLAWKLSRVVRGTAPDTLLDTYESERSPHTRTFTELSIYLAHAIDEMATKQRAPGEEEVAMVAPRPSLGPGIHDATAPAGTLSPQSQLPDGSLFDDTVGYAFVVIGDAALLKEVSPVTKAFWQALDAKVISADTVPLMSWLTQLGARAVVIRPDRYILGVASEPADLDRLATHFMPVLTSHSLVAAVNEE